MEVVDLIIAETKESNESQGTSFDIAGSVIAQLPFFACNRIFFDISIQRDIEKYVYCEKFGVPPYRGPYGEQPAKWVNRAFAIKAALAKKEKREISDGRKNTNTISS